MSSDPSTDRCRNGHPFDEANTYWRSGKTRACKTCRRARSREHQRRKRAAQKAQISAT